MSPRIFLSPPHIGLEERAIILDALDSNWIAPLGPHVDAFEHDMATFLGIEHAVALSSGTAALHLSLLLLKVASTDEVLVSDLTFAATANAIRYVGAQPVFVDSERHSWNMDPELLEESLASRARRGRRPAAVIVVDIYGQTADFGRIVDVCNRHDVALIEDAAEALGATSQGRAAGTHGLMGTLSFNGNKIITTSGGGMLVTGRADFAARARHLATQARLDEPHYEHAEVGYNYRLSNLLAAVGRAQLRKLEERVSARRRINSRYREQLSRLPGLQFMPEAPWGRSTCWLTCVVIDPAVAGADREAVRRALQTDGIEARPLWKPMHMQPAFRDYACVGGAVASDLFARGLCLPSGSSLSPDSQDRICEIIRSSIPARS